MVLMTRYAFAEDRIGIAKLQPALLRVSHQIHSETIDILQGVNLRIVATIDAPEEFIIGL